MEYSGRPSRRLEGNVPYLLISMILRHSQLGFAGVMEYSLAASMIGTYVLGTTSTAFVMSEARRRMTHALGRMPLLDAMAGVVYSAVDVCAAHCRLSETLQKYLATTTTTKASHSRIRSSRKAVSHASRLPRTEPYRAPITQKMPSSPCGDMTGEKAG